MGLFEPAWKNKKLKPGDPKHWQKIVNSIDKLKTEEELMEVLCTSPLDSARIEALDRLSTERILRFALEQFPESFSDGLYNPSYVEKRIANRIIDRIIDIPPWGNKLLRENGFKVDDEALSTLKRLADDSRNSAVRNVAYDKYRILTEYLDYCRKMNSPEERFRMAETAQERVEALKKCKNQKLITEALYDKEYIVREEAIRRIKDHNVFVQWILSESAILPVGAETFWKKFDELNREEQEQLIKKLRKKRSKNVDYKILFTRACGKLGHIPGNNCFCTRCGAELPHDFDENGVCRNCQARIIEEEEIRESQGIKYQRVIHRKIIYPDGTLCKHLEPSIENLVDSATMNWLFPDDYLPY